MSEETAVGIELKLFIPRNVCRKYVLLSNLRASSDAIAELQRRLDVYARKLVEKAAENARDANVKTLREIDLAFAATQ